MTIFSSFGADVHQGHSTEIISLTCRVKSIAQLKIPFSNNKCEDKGFQGLAATRNLSHVGISKECAFRMLLAHSYPLCHSEN